jgi:hypothetical protein
MKSFEPRSMMQEHPHLSSEPARGGKGTYSWTSQSILNFDFTLGIVAPPFTKGIQSERICNIM